MLARDRHRLRMISGRVRHHSARQRLLRQRQNQIRRPANFKRAAALQILAFEEHPPARRRVESLIRHHRSPPRQGSNAQRRLPDVARPYGQFHLLTVTFPSRSRYHIELTSPLRARLLLIAAAVLFSTGCAAIKAPALTGWQIAAFRSGIATIFLLAAVPETRRGWSLRMLPVAACYAATLVSFVLANRLTT